MDAQTIAREDRILRQCFDDQEAMGQTKGAITWAAKKLHRADKYIRKRARALGLYKPQVDTLFGSDEIDLMKSMGVDATPEEVQAALRKIGCERTIGSIKTKRGKLGIVRKGAALSQHMSLTRRKWHHTDAIDEAIKKAFSHKYKGRGAQREAMKATGWPEHAVFRRAVELGLTKAHSDLPWTHEEEEFLRENAWQSPMAVQFHMKKRFGKTRTQSSIMAKRGRLKCMKNLEGLNHRQMEECFGVGQSMVDKWLNSGKIRGILRFPEHQAVGRSVWYFPNWEIRRFILENLEEIDLARVEKFWFVNLVADGDTQKQSRKA